MHKPWRPAPMAHSYRLHGACNLDVPGSNPGRAGYLSSWFCIYSAVQRPGVYTVLLMLLCIIKNP